MGSKIYLSKICGFRGTHGTPSNDATEIKNKFMNKYFKISLYSRLKDFWFLCNQGPHSNWLISQLLLKKFLHFHMFQNLWKFLKTNTNEFSIWQLLSKESFLLWVNGNLAAFYQMDITFLLETQFGRKNIKNLAFKHMVENVYF